MVARARGQIFLLDWIRFLAAVLVSGWHLGYRLFDSSAPHINRFATGLPSDHPILPGVTIFGWIGVQIFFVISGLVIAFSAERASPTRFFVSRVVRLMPVIVVGTLIIAAIDVLVWKMPLLRVAREAALTLMLSPVGTIAPQFWTIPVEAMFYAGIWLLIRTDLFQKVEFFALGVVLVDAAYWVAVEQGYITPMTQLARVLLLQHGFYFAIGIAIFRISVYGLSTRRALIIACGCLLAAVEVRFALGKYNIAEDVGASAWFLPYGIWMASLGLIMAATRYQEEIGRFIQDWSLASLSRAIGLATYPLYFLHIHIGGLVATAAVMIGAPPVAAVLLGFAVSVAVALAIALVIEPPLGGFIKGVAERVSLAQPVVAGH